MNLLKEYEKAYFKKDHSSLYTISCKMMNFCDDEVSLTYNAYAYFNFKFYNLLSETLSKLHKLYPANYHAYNLESLTYLLKGDFKKALKLADEGLKIKNCCWLTANKIEALISLERIDEAYEIYKSSKFTIYNFTKALINCSKYSEVYKYNEMIDSELIDYYLIKYNTLNDNDESLRVCEEILKIDENNKDALFYKIICLQHSGRCREALKLLDRPIKLYPEDSSFYFLKASILYWDFAEIDGACENYENAFLLIDDTLDYSGEIIDFIMALNKKAEFHLKKEEYLKAVEAYDKILFLKTDEFGALEAINMILKKHNIKYSSENYEKSLKAKLKIDKGCIT